VRFPSSGACCAGQLAAPLAPPASYEPIDHGKQTVDPAHPPSPSFISINGAGAYRWTYSEYATWMTIAVRVLQRLAQRLGHDVVGGGSSPRGWASPPIPRMSSPVGTWAPGEASGAAVDKAQTLRHRSTGGCRAEISPLAVEDADELHRFACDTRRQSLFAAHSSPAEPA